jgi:hypothetical protein
MYTMPQLYSSTMPQLYIALPVNASGKQAVLEACLDTTAPRYSSLIIHIL